MALNLYPLPLSWRAVFPLWGSADWSELTGRAAPELAGAGELWLNDDRPGGSRVLAGELAGSGLDELVARAPEEILGPAWAATGRFPLLLKFIKPDEWLSVQVHPDEGQGRSKHEAWYVLAARSGAEIVLGLRPGLGPEDLAREMDRGRWSEILQFWPAAAGQSFCVPAGLVHALGPGLLLFEIQQNQDITFRFHDWDRLGPDGRPRPLHRAEALAALRPGLRGGPVGQLSLALAGGRRTFLAAGPHFLLCRLELEASLPGRTGGRFLLLTGLKGRGLISGGGRETDIGPGQTVLIPAGLGEYEIRPLNRLVLLESSVPDLNRDVVEPLRLAGRSESEIAVLIRPNQP